jgi:CelD/BcsL family acetyltransferase involved in cellulose biosynthesis
MALTFVRLDLDECDWTSMDALGDRLVFQTREWLEFLSAAFDAEPVVCSVLEGQARVGYFTGLLTRRFGVRILGSPLPGWTTSYMGFNLAEGVSRREALGELLAYAHDVLRCAHVEVRDRLLPPEPHGGARIKQESFDTLEVDLEADEDELYSRMESRSRGAIRKAAKANVTIEPTADHVFADEYYAQLEDVFANQSLAPTYGIEVVRALIEHLQPTGRLLLLRALSAEGECIATGIFPGMNTTAYFWGGASWRSRPIPPVNEALIWEAMRYWKSRGVRALDLGAGDYKRKFGVRDVAVPHFAHSSRPGLAAMRALIKLLRTSERLRRFARTATSRGRQVR